MAKNGWGHVLAAAVDGYMKGERIVSSKAAAEKEAAYTEEKRGRERTEWAAQDALKSNLAEAGAPGVVKPYGGIPEGMTPADIGMAEGEVAPPQTFRLGNQDFATPELAQAALPAYNEPQNVAARQAAVYQQAGMPEKAVTLETRQEQLAKREQENRLQAMQSGLRALRVGDTDGTIKGLKGSGMFNVGEGDIGIAEEDMDIPGLGKQKTYNVTFPMVGADGKTKPFTLNSHWASMAAMDYEKRMALERQGAEAVSRAEDRKDRAADRDEDRAIRRDLAGATIALRGAQTERQGRMGSGGGGGGGGGSSTRERRITVQGQIGNTNKEIREVDALLKELNAVPTAANKAQAQELQAQRATLVSQRSSLNEEMTSIAEQQTSGNKSQPKVEVPKTVKTSHGQVPKVTSKAQYDNLRPGDKYIPPGGTEVLIKGAKK